MLAFPVYLGISAGVLWPGGLLPSALILGLVILASRGFASDDSPYWRTMALALVSLLACVVFSGGLGTVAKVWPMDPRSLIVVILVQLALLQDSAGAVASSRAATSVVAAAGAAFLIPIQDVAFLKVSPPLLLQLIPVALAPLLALIPVAQMSRFRQSAYRVVEPLLLLAVVGLVGTPFVKDPSSAWTWVSSHLLWSLGTPASLIVLLNLGPRVSIFSPNHEE